MFGFLNFLYPAEKFLTSVLNMLKYNPSTYDIEELTEQMNNKEECELLNGSLDIEQLNEQLKLKNYLIGNFLIKKSIFVFKRNYMGEKTIITLEGINIDIFNKIEKEGKDEIINGEGEKKKSEGGLLDNVINVVVHNLEVNFKNIKIRFFDKENKNVEYTFFINSISYKENPNVEPIRADEKIKYLFVHNKAVFIEGILFKEKYEDNDDIFFSNNEEDKDNKNKFISQNNNLFYIKNTIQMDMFYDIVERWKTGIKLSFVDKPNLIPFKTIIEYVGNMQTINDWFGKNLAVNIIMFIPCGFLSPLFLRKNRIWHIVIFGIILSVIIEMLQALLGVGTVDIDDVILNTFGLLLGFGIYKLIYSVALKNALD